MIERARRDENLKNLKALRVGTRRFKPSDQDVAFMIGDIIKHTGLNLDMLGLFGISKSHVRAWAEGKPASSPGLATARLVWVLHMIYVRKLAQEVLDPIVIGSWGVGSAMTDWQAMEAEIRKLELLDAEPIRLTREEIMSKTGLSGKMLERLLDEANYVPAAEKSDFSVDEVVATN